MQAQLQVVQALSLLSQRLSPLVANHIWQSTLFAVAAGLLTLAVRKDRAAVRYSLWLAASLKFLVPFSLLIALGARLAPRHTIIPAQTTIYLAAQATQPFAQHYTVTLPAQYPYLTTLFPILAFVWLCGFLALLTRWMIRWRRVSALARTATPITDSRELYILRHLEQIALSRKPIPLLVSKTTMEPGIFGIFRPVLLWPVGISAHLDDAHLKSIVAHELCHVRRRDNLSSALHMLAEALFWFYPPVWWIGARLLHERERACDEAVLGLNTDPETYAESILRACKFSLESPLSCISGVTGSNLKQRIVNIMNQTLTANLTLGKKFLISVCATAAIVLPITFGFVSAPAAGARIQASDITLPAYQVITLKPVTAGDQMTRTEVLPTGFVANNTTVRNLIEFAYNIKNSQLSGGPSWIDSNHYDIEIKTDGTLTPAGGEFKTLGGPQMQHILQAVLADRFNLTISQQTQTQTVYALTVSSTGSKLNPLPEQQQPSVEINGIREAVISVRSTVKTSNGQLSITGPVQSLAGALSNSLDRQVIDKTGLKGNYNIVLQWNESSGHAPDIFAAVQDQLGLTLQPDEASVQVYVIGNIEQPSA